MVCVVDANHGDPQIFSSDQQGQTGDVHVKTRTPAVSGGDVDHLSAIQAAGSGQQESGFSLGSSGSGAPGQHLSKEGVAAGSGGAVKGEHHRRQDLPRVSKGALGPDESHSKILLGE